MFKDPNLELLAYLNRAAPLDVSTDLISPILAKSLDSATKAVTLANSRNHARFARYDGLDNPLFQVEREALVQTVPAPRTAREKIVPSYKELRSEFIKFLNGSKVTWRSFCRKFQVDESEIVDILASQPDLISLAQSKGVPTILCTEALGTHLGLLDYLGNYIDTPHLRKVLLKALPYRGTFTDKELTFAAKQDCAVSNALAAVLAPDINRLLKSLPLESLTQDATIIAWVRGYENVKLLEGIVRDGELEIHHLHHLAALRSVMGIPFTATYSQVWAQGLMDLVTTLPITPKGSPGRFTQQVAKAWAPIMDRLTADAITRHNTDSESVLYMVAQFLRDDVQARPGIITPLINQLARSSIEDVVSRLIDHPGLTLDTLVYATGQDPNLVRTYDFAQRSDLALVLPHLKWDAISAAILASEGRQHIRPMVSTVWTYLAPALVDEYAVGCLTSLSNFSGTLEELRRVIVRMSNLSKL